MREGLRRLSSRITSAELDENEALGVMKEWLFEQGCSFDVVEREINSLTNLDLGGLAADPLADPTAHPGISQGQLLSPRVYQGPPHTSSMRTPSAVAGSISEVVAIYLGQKIQITTRGPNVSSIRFSWVRHAVRVDGASQ